MSGIYIPGLEMPNKKNGAVFIIYPDGKCAFEDGKTYQAAPVPDHGRLVDADALIKRFDNRVWYCGYDRDDALELLSDATTIIPAEEGE